MVPLSDVLDLDQLLIDLGTVTRRHLPRPALLGFLAWSILRNFRAGHAPEGYRLPELVRQLLSQIGVSGGRLGASEGDAAEFPWRLLFVAGMWFQDLYNFDFDRTAMCIIPYGTEEGEISFCAYNSGVGLRQVVESQHRTCSAAEWHETHGRHPVYAGGVAIPMPGAPGGDETAEDSPEPGGRRRLRLVG
jgi:7,8-dihydro-6-hydroxymethylpterin dimethyltransferase